MAEFGCVRPSGQNRNYLGTLKSDQTFTPADCRRPETASADLTQVSRLYKADGTPTPAYLYPEAATRKGYKLIVCKVDTIDTGPTTGTQASYRNKVMTDCLDGVVDWKRNVFRTAVFVYDTVKPTTYGATNLEPDRFNTRATQRTIVNVPVVVAIDDDGAFVHEVEVQASVGIVPEGPLYLQGLTGTRVDGKQFSDSVGGADTMTDTGKVTSGGKKIYKFTLKGGLPFAPDGVFSARGSFLWNLLIKYRRGLVTRQVVRDLIPGTMMSCVNPQPVDRAAGEWTCDNVVPYSADALMDYGDANGEPSGMPDVAHSVHIEDTIMIVPMLAADMTADNVAAMSRLQVTNSDRIANGTEGDLMLNWVQPDAILLPGVTVRVEAP